MEHNLQCDKQLRNIGAGAEMLTVMHWILSPQPVASRYTNRSIRHTHTPVYAACLSRSIEHSP
jgi:hypothetical protein